MRGEQRPGDCSLGSLDTWTMLARSLSLPAHTFPSRKVPSNTHKSAWPDAGKKFLSFLKWWNNDNDAWFWFWPTAKWLRKRLSFAPFKNFLLPRHTSQSSQENKICCQQPITPLCSAQFWWFLGNEWSHMWYRNWTSIWAGLRCSETCDTALRVAKISPQCSWTTLMLSKEPATLRLTGRRHSRSKWGCLWGRRTLPFCSSCWQWDTKGRRRWASWEQPALWNHRLLSFTMLNFLSPWCFYCGKTYIT